MIWMLVLQALGNGGTYRVNDLLLRVDVATSMQGISKHLRNLVEWGLAERVGRRTSTGYRYQISAMGRELLSNALEKRPRPPIKGGNPMRERAEKLRFGRTWLAPLTTGAELQLELSPPQEWPFK